MRDPTEGTNITYGAMDLSFGTKKRMPPEMNEVTAIATSTVEINS